MDPAIVFIIVTGIFTLICLVFSFICFARKTRESNFLGATILFGAFAQGGYLMSICAQRKVLAAIGAGAYFSSVDILLWFLLCFILIYTGREKEIGTKMQVVLTLAYGVFDVLIMILNPIHYIAIDFENVGAMIGGFRYIMKPLYYGHLAFAYLLIILILFNLIIAIIKTPGTYKKPLIFCLGALLLAAGINAVFLLMQGENSSFAVLDYSMLMYGGTSVLFYVSCFVYPEAGMRHQLQGWITDNLNQGIALFDYRGQLSITNKKLGEQFPKIDFTPKMQLSDFVTSCGVSIPGEKLDGSYSTICFSRRDHGSAAISCDYKGILDKNGILTGSVFSFTTKEQEIDSLTGFVNLSSFQSNFKIYTQEKIKNITVVIFDLNRLVSINAHFGRAVGDRSVAALAKCMKKSFPEDTLFVRDWDAGLIAVMKDAISEDVSKSIENTENALKASAAREGLPPNISAQAGYSVVKGDAPDITEAFSDAVKIARTSMKEKKLLDDSSYSSRQMSVLMMSLQQADSDTQAHVTRTRKLGAALGEKINLTDDEQSKLSLLCLLHDIGKIGVPLDILNKPGKLSETEWKVIQAHAEKGYQISLASEELSSIAEMVRYHHERWDGKGYPKGLKGEEIPLLSRVIALVDAYDAMRSKRSYKPGLTFEYAIGEIKRCAGNQFDPRLAETFVELLLADPEFVHYDDEDIKNENLKMPSTDLEEKKGRVLLKPDKVEVSKDKLYLGDVTYCRYVLDNENRIVDVDEKFEALTGYDKNDISTGLLFQRDLIPEAMRDEYSEKTKSQLAKKAAAYVAHPLLRKDGTVLEVLCYGAQFYDSASGMLKSEILVTRYNEAS